MHHAFRASCGATARTSCHFLTPFRHWPQVALRASNTAKLYCGGRLDDEPEPRLDEIGFCGPVDGPQCLSCNAFQATVERVCTGLQFPSELDPPLEPTDGTAPRRSVRVLSPAVGSITEGLQSGDELANVAGMPPAGVRSCIASGVVDEVESVFHRGWFTAWDISQSSTSIKFSNGAQNISGIGSWRWARGPAMPSRGSSSFDILVDGVRSTSDIYIGISTTDVSTSTETTMTGNVVMRVDR